MYTRGIKAIFFSLIFLTSKIGLALNVHYCSGHIEEIALAWNADGCEMSMEKGQDLNLDVTFAKNHCCQDETIFIQNNHPQKTVNDDFQISTLAIPNCTETSFNAIKIIPFEEVFAHSNFLVPKNKIFLLNQSFIFYG